eukprot:scaffold111495_cov72-Phaeocystis_antarctica.AAC.5
MNSPSESLLADFASEWNSAQACSRNWAEERLSAEASSRNWAEERLRAEESLADAIAIKHERERRRLQEAQTCEEEAQAKLRVHLTPRQSDGRISNSLGIDG